MSARRAAPVLAALVSALALSCGGDRQGPVRVAESFADAVQRRDIKAVLPMLEASALAKLEALAARASDQVGGRRRVEPWEMLQVARLDPLRQIASAELAEELDADGDPTTARVRLTDSQRATITLTLVLEDGSWHVRIPSAP